MSDSFDFVAYKKEREDLNHRTALCMYEMLGHRHEPFIQRMAEILAAGRFCEDDVRELEEIVRVYHFRLKNQKPKLPKN